MTANHPQPSSTNGGIMTNGNATRYRAQPGTTKVAEPTTSLVANGHEKHNNTCKDQSRPEKEEGEESVQRLARRQAKAKSRLSVLLPSTYMRRLMPTWLYRWGLYLAYLFWFTVGVFVIRKTDSAVRTMRYVREHAHTLSLESIERSEEFARLVTQIDADGDAHAPALLFLNQHALNMTFNFLCNTQIYPGVHKRFIFVTLDDVARDTLKRYWPELRIFHWPTPCLYKQFSFAEGAYQTIYILRANLAVALIKRGISVWFMQQDTFWRRNFFDLELERKPGYDILFDQVGHGNSSQRTGWVNGANFFIRANNHTREFFEAVAAKLEHWYTPDMGIMIHQCHTWSQPKCEFIPYRIGHCWEWMYSGQKHPPHIMQLDCETDGRSKLQQLALFGFYFTKSDGRTCDPDAVRKVQLAMERGEVDVGGPVRLSWGRLQFKIYWWLVDYILCAPWLGPLLKPYLPLVGYILMFTMA